MAIGAAEEEISLFLDPSPSMKKYIVGTGCIELIVRRRSKVSSVLRHVASRSSSNKGAPEAADLALRTPPGPRGSAQRCWTCDNHGTVGDIWKEIGHPANLKLIYGPAKATPSSKENSVGAGNGRAPAPAIMTPSQASGPVDKQGTGPPPSQQILQGLATVTPRSGKGPSPGAQWRQALLRKRRGVAGASVPAPAAQASPKPKAMPKPRQGGPRGPGAQCRRTGGAGPQRPSSSTCSRKEEAKENRPSAPCRKAVHPPPGATSEIVHDETTTEMADRLLQGLIEAGLHKDVAEAAAPAHVTGDVSLFATVTGGAPSAEDCGEPALSEHLNELFTVSDLLMASGDDPHMMTTPQPLLRGAGDVGCSSTARRKRALDPGAVDYEQGGSTPHSPASRPAARRRGGAPADGHPHEMLTPFAQDEAGAHAELDHFFDQEELLTLVDGSA